MKYIIVFCTVNNYENAKKIVKILVEEKLVACANIVPNLTSIYSWKDEIVEDNEVLMILKTKEELFKYLKERIVEIHDYEVPEIISIEIKEGLAEYLKWIEDVTK